MAARSFSKFRAVATTRSPAASAALTTPVPMPAVAPVTNQTLLIEVLLSNPATRHILFTHQPYVPRRGRTNDGAGAGSMRTAHHHTALKTSTADASRDHRSPATSVRLLGGFAGPWQVVHSAPTMPRPSGPRRMFIACA